MRSRLLALLALASMVVTGCPAVFPEIGTRMKVAPADAVLDPPPPETLVWLRFMGGKVPEKTRDGRKWDQVLGSLPDPYAKLMVNEAELFRTTVQSDTLEPTWPDAPRGNFEIPRGAKLRVELWDSSPINDAPIGIRDFSRPTTDQLIDGKYTMELKGGGEVTIAFEPAHPMFGLGFWFELRNDSAYITRFAAGSPAERAGIQKGDQILGIGGKKVAGMTPDEVRSLLNSAPVSGLDLELRRGDGTTSTVNVKEGPIYPTYADFGKID
jgi:membrane-associated protease RseP (regulator of RpoE activity)